MKKILLPLLVAAICQAGSANALEIIAIGNLTGNSDLSGLTGTLENGLAANVLGGLGSGLAWAGGNTFLALPDRGPNATAYNSGVDDTSSYISRFHTVTLKLTANAPGSTFAYSLTPTLNKTTLLSSTTPLNYGTGTALGLPNGAPSINTATKQYFTGRSDNYAAGSSTNPNNGRLDPEAIRVSNDGKSVFVSDEYGPYVYQFDRATGERIRTFDLPANLAVTNLSPNGATEISGNTVGRVANKGMEGLAITPDGKTLVGIMQAPLEQDTKKNVRIVTIDIATGATKEFAYKLTTGSGVSEIVALNDHEFVVGERDGAGKGDGTSAAVKQYFKIDLTGAQDVSGLKGDLSSKAVSKSLFFDLVKLLNAKGITSDQIPAKIEGIAFGDDIIENGITKHVAYITNDNDFVPGVAGTNNFYAVSFTDAELSGSAFVAQSISAVPEADSYAMLLAGLGLVGFVARRRQ